MSKFSTPEAVNAEINGTLALLDTEYNLDEPLLSKNVVLFIGITGTGKSTISQFLAGNPKLRAIRDGSASDIFITDDNDKVSESTTESKTLLPELVPIPNTDTVLADCPGFSDTRSAKHDIAATVFTKKLLEKSEQVKIMVATAHHSVRKGVDRRGFTDLLDHAVNFINDIDKYKDSIGLLVTKVENKIVEDENGDPQYLPDNIIINEIGSFLSVIKVELLKKPPSDKISKQIQLIDMFIAKNDNNEYSKIGIFRRPTKVGDLNLDKRMTKNRDAVKNIINNVLQSSQVAPNDFGLSLSADSKYIVTKMRETLNAKLSNILDEFIRVYSQQLFDSRTDDIDNIKTAILRSNFIIDLLESDNVPKMVVTNLMQRIEISDADHPAQQITDWKNHQKYIQFLQSISPTEDDADDFSKYHMRLDDFKDKLSANVNLMGHNMEDTIDQAISKVITEVMMTVKNETLNLDMSSHLPYSKLSEQIDAIYNSCEQFKVNNQNKTILPFEEFLSDFKANFKISKNQAQKLESYQADIDFFKSNVTATFADGHQEKWLQGFTAPFSDIKRVAEWYSFITESFSKLTDYESQNVVTKSSSNLKIWANFKALRKQLSDNANLNRFLESRSTLSLKEQIDLNDLVDSIKSSPEHTCQESKLVVKDNLVKLSKVVTELFPKCSSFTELYIFATQSVFIDVSLVEPGKNVYIIAPTWNIMGPKVIDLRGVDGKEKHSDSISKAGNPGQPGGNFVGIGDKFVNDNDLTIEVSGGNGGNGVDGEGGRGGTNGHSPNTPDDGYYLFFQTLCHRKIRSENISGWTYVGEFGNDQWEYKMFGTNGTPGLPGGNGGSPGYGANPGNILVNSIKMRLLANPGYDGKQGIGGKGGPGGEHGNSRHVVCRNDGSFLFIVYHASISKTWLEPRGNAQNGNDGYPGIEGNPEEPAEPQPFEPLSSVVTQYEQYVRQKTSRFVDPLEFINRHIPNNRKRRSVSVLHKTPVTDNNKWAPQTLNIYSISGNLGAYAWTSKFSLSSAIALADLFIRKLMKTKPTDVKSQSDSNWENLLVQAEVLKIIEKCETMWNESNQSAVGQKPFDPLCLQRQLNSRLRQLADR